MGSALSTTSSTSNNNHELSQKDFKKDPMYAQKLDRLIKRKPVNRRLIEEVILEKSLLTLKSEKGQLDKKHKFYKHFIDTVGDMKDAKRRFEFLLPSPNKNGTINDRFEYIIRTGWFNLSRGGIPYTDPSSELDTAKSYIIVPLFKSTPKEKALYAKILSLDRFYRSREFKRDHFGIFAGRMVYKPMITRKMTVVNNDEMIKVDIDLSNRRKKQNATEFYKVNSSHKKGGLKTNLLDGINDMSDVSRVIKFDSNVYIEISVASIMIKFPKNKKSLIEYRLCPTLKLIAISDDNKVDNKVESKVDNKIELKLLETQSAFRENPNVLQKVNDNHPIEVEVRESVKSSVTDNDEHAVMNDSNEQSNEDN